MRAVGGLRWPVCLAVIGGAHFAAAGHLQGLGSEPLSPTLLDLVALIGLGLLGLNAASRADRFGRRWATVPGFLLVGIASAAPTRTQVCGAVAFGLALLWAGMIGELRDRLPAGWTRHLLAIAGLSLGLVAVVSAEAQGSAGNSTRLPTWTLGVGVVLLLSCRSLPLVERAAAGQDFTGETWQVDAATAHKHGARVYGDATSWAFAMALGIGLANSLSAPLGAALGFWWGSGLVAVMLPWSGLLGGLERWPAVSVFGVVRAAFLAVWPLLGLLVLLQQVRG